ncbi:IclR family transcriptional regulator domain-containing protein [Porticoccus sp. GXU_MW_L64]
MTKAIQPILRALSILQSMNRRQMSTLGELQQDTQLPKPTIHRLLGTLIQGGYVQKNEDMGIYSLTSEVLSLSDGFHDNSFFVEAAAPIAEKITRKVKWPVAVGNYDVDAMVVRYSTRSHSSLTMRNTTVNQRFPMLASAMGQAYLGACSGQERRQILSTLRNLESDKSALIHSRYHLRTLLNKIARQGYGLRIGNTGESSHLSVPVMSQQNIIGVIGISLFSSCYNEDTHQEYFQLLEQAAKDISVQFERLHDS